MRYGSLSIEIKRLPSDRSSDAGKALIKLHCILNLKIWKYAFLTMFSSRLLCNVFFFSKLRHYALVGDGPNFRLISQMLNNGGQSRISCVILTSLFFRVTPLRLGGFVAFPFDLQNSSFVYLDVQCVCRLSENILFGLDLGLCLR